MSLDTMNSGEEISLSAEDQEKREAYEAAVEGDLSGFALILGEGFDMDYFADKLDMFPHNEIRDGWNEFLEEEDGGQYKDRQIEVDSNVLIKAIEKISGLSDAPTMFPVFIEGIKDYYEKEGISADHVTPERMEKFYEMISSGAALEQSQAE